MQSLHVALHINAQYCLSPQVSVERGGRLSSPTNYFKGDDKSVESSLFFLFTCSFIDDSSSYLQWSRLWPRRTKVVALLYFVGVFLAINLIILVSYYLAQAWLYLFHSDVICTMYLYAWTHEYPHSVLKCSKSVLIMCWMFWKLKPHQGSYRAAQLILMLVFWSL